MVTAASVGCVAGTLIHETTFLPFSRLGLSEKFVRHLDRVHGPQLVPGKIVSSLTPRQGRRLLRLVSHETMAQARLFATHGTREQTVPTHVGANAVALRSSQRR